MTIIQNLTASTPVRPVAILAKVGKMLKDMTLIIPLAQLIFDLCFQQVTNRHLVSKLVPKLSPLARERLREKKVKVREIARRAGIAHPERISVFVAPFQTGFSASKHVMFIPPAELVKKEDLPQDLPLEKYDDKNLVSIVKFHEKFSVWLAQKFLACDEFKTDADQDSLNILKRLKNETVREKMFDAVIGHELGHSYYNHTRKDSLVRFGLRLLSLPTLGLTSLFEERLMQKLKRRQEWEADLFSARKLGGAEGLIADFSQGLELGQTLYNGLAGIKGLTHLYDEKGNYRYDHTHPPLTRRIAYLRPYLTP